MAAPTITHKVLCTHSLNSLSKRHYAMPCAVLKTMPDGRLKIRVYGYRGDTNMAVSRIRYVPKTSVKELGPDHVQST
ncbi:hypothetical protein [Marinimicrobium sp. ABcell2]|uniref:hypothetical protein n=1 Tax=Marinimicrobium sp. ABcell2 TaxID=3069751 RepID=UPI0027B5391E|nr:hypothetical protein [Marinimicrobium sp. ABcell2]MDQ2077550.1 hypothetical protein [Marinimicrobium sp. ABcell2]